MKDNGFAKCIADEDTRNVLKGEFQKIGFTALLFTDSRGIFQYYNLNRLWPLIEVALKNNLRDVNVAVEPVTIAEIYSHVYDGKVFVNELKKPVPHFDFHTIHTDILGGQNGYVLDKQTCLDDIKNFILDQIK